MSEDIDLEFSTLQAFILHDLDVLTRLDEGTNYAAVLVAVSGCEALGSVRYGREHCGARFFEEYVLPEAWRPLADDLWNALRNGLAHSYETKSIVQVGDTAVEVAISWRAKPHLHYDQEKRRLFINVQELVAAIRRAIGRYQHELVTEPSLRDNFIRGRRTSREVRVPAARLRVWQQVLRESELSGR